MSKQKRHSRMLWNRSLFFALILVVVALATYSGLKMIKGQAQTEPQPATPSTVTTTTTPVSTVSSTIQGVAREATLETTATTSSEAEDSTAVVAAAADLPVAELSSYANQVSYAAYDLQRGALLFSSESQQLIAASVIKVFVMEYIYHLAAAGDISLTTLVNGETIEALVTRMIQISDNGATNSLLTHFGMEPMNTFFREQGYRDTVVQRQMLDTVAQSQGLENYTSLDDTLAFLKKVYAKRDTFPYSGMLAIMSGQQLRTKISSQLPAEVIVASKTGELAGVENDIGLVLSETHPFAMVVLANQVNNSGAMRQAIGSLALAIYQQE